MAEIYDFIVVGGGTSGSVLASRLARSSSSPTVLLLEGGGSNDDPALRSTDRRYSVAFTDPFVNWGYESIPQKQLVGQRIPCARGRGLGGSSAINFSAWLIGDKEDFNEWADAVDDSCWEWEGDHGVKERFRKIENLHYATHAEQNKYLDQQAQEKHSKEGAVDLSYDQVWSELESQWFKAAKEFNMKVNGDINSGDPTGFGLGPSTCWNGARVTASTAYLSFPPSNLTIMTNSVVAEVIFNDTKRAIGVKTISGNYYYTSKEIILSAGSLDTPKILLLSGVGPADELSALSIPVIHDLPTIGKNMKDHCALTLTILLKSEAVAAVSEIPSVDSPNPVIARDPLLQTGAQVPMGWFSSPIIKASSELADLDEKTKSFLLKVPSYEFIVVGIPMAVALLPLDPSAKVITFLGAIMNAQSSGSVILSSKDPSSPAIIDPNYLSHPYDRRVAIECLRSLIEYSKMPTFAAITDTCIDGPAGDSDEALFEHCKKSVIPVWHFASTCRMGRESDETAVVDKEFRVRGVTGLRVVDLSVAVVIPNNHTQSTAYLIGETAAEKMIKEYSL